MEIKQTLLESGKTYGIELRPRNYPKFLGRYNAYLSIYGQLTGQYLGCIEIPMQTDITEAEAPELSNIAEQFIKDHKYFTPKIW